MTKLSKKGEHSMFNLAWLFLLQGLIYSHRTGSKEVLRYSLDSQYGMHQFLDVFLKSVLVLLLPVVHICSSISILVLLFRFKGMIMLWLFKTQILRLLIFHLSSAAPQRTFPIFTELLSTCHASTFKRKWKHYFIMLCFASDKRIPYFIWHQWWQY